MSASGSESKQANLNLSPPDESDTKLIENAIRDMKQGQTSVPCGPVIDDVYNTAKYTIHHPKGSLYYYIVGNAKDKQVGQGGMSAPQLAHRFYIDNNNQMQRHPNPFVLKQVEGHESADITKAAVQNEYKLFKKCYKQSEYYLDEKDGFIFVPFLKGETIYKEQDLKQDKMKVNFDVNSLSLEQRIDLANQISEWLYIIHTRIPGRGEAYIWGDISQNNFHFYMNKGRVYAYPLDFGASLPVTSLHQVVDTRDPDVTPGYIAPELYESKGFYRKTIGSDTWAVAGILLGLNNNSHNPFKDKFKARLQHAAIREAKETQLHFVENEQQANEEIEKIKKEPDYTIVLYKKENKYYAKLNKYEEKDTFQISLSPDQERILDEKKADKSQLIAAIWEKIGLLGKQGYLIINEDNQSEAKVPLNFTGFFEGENYEALQWIKPTYENFIKKMQVADYKDRPTPLEFRLFHGILNQAVKRDLKEDENVKKALDIILTKGIDPHFDKAASDFLTNIYSHYTLTEEDNQKLNQFWNISTRYFSGPEHERNGVLKELHALGTSAPTSRGWLRATLNSIGTGLGFVGGAALGAGVGYALGLVVGVLAGVFLGGVGALILGPLFAKLGAGIGGAIAGCYVGYKINQALTARTEHVIVLPPPPYPMRSASKEESREESKPKVIGTDFKLAPLIAPVINIESPIIPVDPVSQQESISEGGEPKQEPISEGEPKQEPNPNLNRKMN